MFLALGLSIGIAQMNIVDFRAFKQTSGLRYQLLGRCIGIIESLSLAIGRDLSCAGFKFTFPSATGTPNFYGMIDSIKIGFIGCQSNLIQRCFRFVIPDLHLKLLAP